MDEDFRRHSEQAALLEPVVNKLSRKTARLTAFNAAAIGFPYVSAAAALAITGGITPEIVVGLAFTSAVSNQISRIWKGRLRNAFENIWNEADPATRPITLGFIKETMQTKIGKSTNVIALEDFQFNKRHNRTAIAATVIGGILAPVAAPLIYFISKQTVEHAEGRMIQTATRYTERYYEQLKASASAPAAPEGP